MSKCLKEAGSSSVAGSLLLLLRLNIQFTSQSYSSVPSPPSLPPPWPKPPSTLTGKTATSLPTGRSPSTFVPSPIFTTQAGSHKPQHAVPFPLECFSGLLFHLRNKTRAYYHAHRGETQPLGSSDLRFFCLHFLPLFHRHLSTLYLPDGSGNMARLFF